MAEFEPLAGGGAENVRVKINGTYYALGDVNDGEDVDLGSIPVTATIGGETATIREGGDYDLQTNQQWVTKATDSGPDGEYNFEDIGLTVTDLRKGTHIEYTVTAPSTTTFSYGSYSDRRTWGGTVSGRYNMENAGFSKGHLGAGGSDDNSDFYNRGEYTVKVIQKEAIVTEIN